MNKKLIVLLLMSIINMSLVAMQWGEITQDVELYPGYIQQDTMYWACASADYTTGGVTFNYPDYLYSDAPQVFVSIQSSNYDAGTLITPIITNNTSDSTTVNVNVGNLTDIEEAADGSVTVYLWAVGSNEYQTE